MTAADLEAWICEIATSLNKTGMRTKARDMARMIVDDNDFDTEGDIAQLTSSDFQEMGISMGNARALVMSHHNAVASAEPTFVVGEASWRKSSRPWSDLSSHARRAHRARPQGDCLRA